MATITYVGEPKTLVLSTAELALCPWVRIDGEVPSAGIKRSTLAGAMVRINNEVGGVPLPAYAYAYPCVHTVGIPSGSGTVVAVLACITRSPIDAADAAGRCVSRANVDTEFRWAIPLATLFGPHMCTLIGEARQRAMAAVTATLFQRDVQLEFVNIVRCGIVELAACWDDGRMPDLRPLGRAIDAIAAVRLASDFFSLSTVGKRE